MYEIKEIKAQDFPENLLEIPQPPKRLNFAGTLPDWSEKICLTVVGTRRPSAYGKDVVDELISELTSLPIIIVSGLAIGIDTLAHEAALRYGLTTVAFPGSGLDPSILYPRQNLRLAEKILENGGALFSEHDSQLKAAPWTFPERNRLMAGLAKATLIIEATPKSGTLITARLALEYNREVLAIPGSIYSPQSAGPNFLIRSGATAITKADDLKEALGFMEDKDLKEKELPLLSPDEEKIITPLKNGPIEKDELIRQSGLSSSTANTLLVGLELKGVIKESFGEIRLM